MTSQSVRLLNRPIINILNDHLIEYPTPVNLNYMWNFGSTAGVFLVIQILTGVFLAMHYTPHIDLAFLSVEHIMRDVNNGWFIRYLHANGASMFFLVVYIHVGRGLYYGSYQKPRGFVWALGVIILILMMATAFMGYVLPWGQMSFWAATVITNLFSAFPYVGEPIVAWLWGGFSVDNATLNRFFSFHYLLPFLITGATIIHIAILHQNGSNNPLGISGGVDKISFYPYFIFKDLASWIVFGIFYAMFVYFAPNYLGHTDNYIEANPMVTPAHIVPEWYFLPQYAILRSIPHKLGGVVAMLSSLLILLILPYVGLSETRSSSFRLLRRKLFWIFVLNFLILGWIGGCAPESPYLEIGQVATVFYFAYFIVITPALGVIEKVLLTYKV
ncbi:apocytochrome b (mitochondrion) [Hemiselmis andersenii]|uniref:Cytochrome b n=1 Tax=Hemiselmis andersenii TaxID=464988 RepID=B2MWS1_HEMAN|nr:apocytochrome b [Hemiselmis andersenii]ACC78213.1 apocytochrome b [Hemiselmis andersenii]